MTHPRADRPRARAEEIDVGPARLAASPPRASPSGRITPARTTSGKFEDPLLIWPSSQSDDAMSPSPSTPAHHGSASPSPSAKHCPPVAQPSHHPSYPSSPSKAYRVNESFSVLDAVQHQTSVSSPHSPAALQSPIRSQSPTTRAARSSSMASGNPASASPATSLFDKLRMIGGRGLFGSSGPSGPVSAPDGGRSPKSKSLTFAGVDDMAGDDRHTHSPTHGASASPRTTSHTTSPRWPVTRDSAEDAAAAAIASIDRGSDFEPASGGGSGAEWVSRDYIRERHSGGGSLADSASARALSKIKSMGGQAVSMGGRPLSLNASWRSSGALTLTTAAPGALPEGGLQSQTHEALQQLLGSTLSAEPSNKRISAPGHSPVNNVNGGGGLGAVVLNGGRSLRNDLGASLSTHNSQQRPSHDDRAGEPRAALDPRVVNLGSEARFASDGGAPRRASIEERPSVRFAAVSDGGGLMSSLPRGGRRFARSTTDKQLEDRLSQAVTLERSYADLQDGSDDDNNDDVF